MPGGAVGSQAGARTELPAPPGECPAEAGAAVAGMGCQDGPWGTSSSGATGDAAMEPHNACAVTMLPAGQTARDQEVPERRAGTSPPRAAVNGDPTVLPGDQSPPGLEKLLLQDSDSEIPTARSRPQRRSGRRSSVGVPHKSRRASLAVRSSLARRRESVARRSVGRACSRKAAAGASPSACRVSRKCLSALGTFLWLDQLLVPLAQSATRFGRGPSSCEAAHWC